MKTQMHAEDNPTLYLIDSSIYIFRAWHMLPASNCDSAQNPVNALFGFADFLSQVIDQTQATHLVCTFDQNHGLSERKRIYPDYKANRPALPAGLARQFPLCRELAQKCGLAHFTRPRYEADDIIGTLAGMAARHSYRTTILSADKDLAQIIGCDDEYWNFAKKERLNATAIQKRFGVRPSQIADMLALSGDKVDNIPGIPGVGQATAARLLRKWDTLDILFENTREVASMRFRGAKHIADLLPEYENTVRLSRQLTGLLLIHDLPDSPAQLVRKPPDQEELMRFLLANNFAEPRRKRLQDSLARR